MLWGEEEDVVAVEDVVLLGPAAGGAALATALYGPSWVQNDQAAKNGEGEEREEQRQEGREEIPPHLGEHGGGGGEATRRHEDL